MNETICRRPFPTPFDLKKPYLYSMKYPIGIQDFRVLREGGYVYVDKT